METDRKGNEKLDIEVEEIELPQKERLDLDLNEYLGRVSKIATAEPFHTEKYGGSYFVKIVSEPLDKIKLKDGTIYNVVATKTLGLQVSKDGKVGFGSKTKCGQWMKKMRAKSISELVGREVKINLTQPRASDGRQFLTF